MNVTDRRQGAELAGTLLRCSTEDAYESSSDVPEIDAFYYWQPVRGGGQILVGRDGSVLFGISSCTLEDVVFDFGSGIRTDLSAFEIG
jgi:hypothetical protein